MSERPFARVAVILFILAGLAAGVGIAAAGSADEPDRNPAARAGDGEAFSADGVFPMETLTGASEPLPNEGMICCGADDREQITNTTEFPWRIVSYLELYDQFGSFKGSCTGTLVGPDAILTAAHCLYNIQTGFTGDIFVVPGANGLNAPFGGQWATDWWVPDGWIDSGGSPLFDWGIIKLPDSTFGDSLGWLPMYAMTTQTLERSDFKPAISGYPGDKPLGTQWLGSRPEFLEVHQFTLDYEIDTAGGQSGSAVFSYNLQASFGGAIVGIHTNGSPSNNSGTRIDVTLLEDILVGCSVMDCTLTAYVEDGATITPGPTNPATPTATFGPTPTATPITTPGPTTPPGPTPTPVGVLRSWGDVGCGGTVDPVDSLKVLRFDAGLLVTQPAGCPRLGDVVAVDSTSREWGDVDCEDGVGPIDSLKVLREDAGLVVIQPSGCPEMGVEVEVEGGISGPCTTGSTDSDGDGLANCWETDGIDVNSDGTIDLDLASLGANPNRRDMFVEADYMDCAMGGCGAGSGASGNRRPNQFSIEDVVAAFDDHGISLHVIVDEGVPEVSQVLFLSDSPGELDDFNDLKNAEPGDPCDGFFGTSANRGSPNCANILAARRLVFRYVIYGNAFLEAPGSSGVGELPGNDFMVTLGGFTDPNDRGIQAGTLMHEMGHTLNLRHGGDDDINCKPNYLSVMTYARQFPELDPTRPLNYSEAVLGTLNENSLSEPAGIGGPAGLNTVFGFDNQAWISPAQGPIPWNVDGDATDVGVASDVNAIPGTCAPSFGQTLTGFDDWDNILINFRSTPDFNDRKRRITVPREFERTAAEVEAAAAAFDNDGDGLANLWDNCPLIANSGQLDRDGDDVGDACDQLVIARWW